MALEQIEGEVTQDDEVLGGVALADPTMILVEGQVQDPMDAVLDAPMAAHGRAKGSGRQRAIQAVVTCLASALLAQLPLGVNGTNCSQAGPVVLVLEPLHGLRIGDHPGPSVLDPS